MDILVIGDAHARPGISNERFRWAGRFAADRKPDVIIDMGDWADMPSLSSYDIGKKSFEGRRYNEDVKAALDAREKFNSGIASANEGLKRKHKAIYNPRKIALGGNHCEGRITRVLDSDPKLIGTIGVDDFKHKQYGWEYHPYREYCEVGGFTFCHYFSSGVMGRPIAGETPALSLLRKQFTSCVAGHLHLWDLAHRTRPDGSRIWGMVAGCFLAEDQIEDYAHQANKLWWRGLTLLKGCNNGDFRSIETVDLQQLKETYS